MNELELRRLYVMKLMSLLTDPADHALMDRIELNIRAVFLPEERWVKAEEVDINSYPSAVFNRTAIAPAASEPPVAGPPPSMETFSAKQNTRNNRYCPDCQAAWSSNHHKVNCVDRKAKAEAKALAKIAVEPSGAILSPRTTGCPKCGSYMLKDDDGLFCFCGYRPRVAPIATKEKVPGQIRAREPIHAGQTL